MKAYPYKFEPIYHEKIWGGRNLERRYNRVLPPGEEIGESWEIADLHEGVSVVANGPDAGTTLTDLTARLGKALLGGAKPMPDGRFPLLVKLLDAEDMLSLQVHPDAEAAEKLGGGAALKTECWFILESREGFIYKGVKAGVDHEQFRRAVEDGREADLVERLNVHDGDFHYLPAGTVHALGGGALVAEVQTPSDTTYRVSDWGRGRPIQVEQSLECMHFEPAPQPPGAGGNVLLATEYFNVRRRTAGLKEPKALPQGRCAILIFSDADGPIDIRHDGDVEPVVTAWAGQTVLLPASLENPVVKSPGRIDWLEVTLPQ